MKKLYRSRHHRFLAGVCGGIGDYFRIDPTLIRLGFIFLAFITAFVPLAIIYLVCSAIIPLEPYQSSPVYYKKLYRSRRNRKIAGICGGISERFHFDPSIVRIVFIALLIFTAVGPMLTAYLIGWAIIPENPEKEDYDIDITP